MTRTEEYLALVRRIREERRKALASVFYVDSHGVVYIPRTAK